MESHIEKLSCERAIQMFQEWGFRVEEGPGHEEVTLILEEPGHRSYYVYEVAQLPQIAEAALRVRRNIGATTLVGAQGMCHPLDTAVRKIVAHVAH